MIDYIVIENKNYKIAVGFAVIESNRRGSRHALSTVGWLREAVFDLVTEMAGRKPELTARRDHE